MTGPHLLRCDRLAQPNRVELTADVELGSLEWGLFTLADRASLRGDRTK